MNSPRSGFRRAAVASWALAGLGAAGVAGASALAYGDTVKPAQDAVQSVASVEQPAVTLPVTAPAPVSTELPAPPVTAQQSAPTYDAPAPQYTQTYAPAPVQTYAPEPAQTYAPAPAAAPQGPVGGSSTSTGKSSSGSSSSSSSRSSSSSSATKHIPMGSSGGPNKAVPHTTAHGS